MRIADAYAPLPASAEWATALRALAKSENRGGIRLYVLRAQLVAELVCAGKAECAQLFLRMRRGAEDQHADHRTGLWP